MAKAANVTFLGGTCMKKDKSIAAYTNIWLNRNQHLWYEREISKQYSRITLKCQCAPKKVIEGIKRINDRRRSKSSQYDPLKHVFKQFEINTK